MVHAIPFAKASEDVGCRSRRCTFFSARFSIFHHVWPHFETVVLPQGHSGHPLNSDRLLCPRGKKALIFL